MRLTTWALALPAAIFYLMFSLNYLSAMFARAKLFHVDDEDRREVYLTSRLRFLFPRGTDLALVSIALDMADTMLRLAGVLYPAKATALYALPLGLMVLHLQAYAFSLVSESRAESSDFPGYPHRSYLRSLILGTAALFTNSLTIGLMLAYGMGF